MKQLHGNQFTPGELITLHHFDKKTGKWIDTEYPKVGGRLRLAHENNDTISIQTEIIQYDGTLATVRAVCETDKGSFCGLGMASIERDEKIAPAILELAETRAIARALRFAGYGVEYCSAEEVSHLPQENGWNSEKELPLSSSESDGCSPPASLASDGIKEDKRKNSSNKYSGTNHTSTNGQSTTHHETIPSTNNPASTNNGRISSKQHSYLISLAQDRGLSKQDLNRQSLEHYGSALPYLTKHQASEMIKSMQH